MPSAYSEPLAKVASLLAVMPPSSYSASQQVVGPVDSTGLRQLLFTLSTGLNVNSSSQILGARSSTARSRLRRRLGNTSIPYRPPLASGPASATCPACSQTVKNRSSFAGKACAATSGLSEICATPGDDRQLSVRSE